MDTTDALSRSRCRERRLNNDVSLQNTLSLVSNFALNVSTRFFNSTLGFQNQTDTLMGSVFVISNIFFNVILMYFFELSNSNFSAIFSLCNSNFNLFNFVIVIFITLLLLME